MDKVEMELKPDTYYTALLHYTLFGGDEVTASATFRGDCVVPPQWPTDPIGVAVHRLMLEMNAWPPPGRLEVFELAEPVAKRIAAESEESP